MKISFVPYSDLLMNVWYKTGRQVSLMFRVSETVGTWEASSNAQSIVQVANFADQTKNTFYTNFEVYVKYCSNQVCLGKLLKKLCALKPV